MEYLIAGGMACGHWSRSGLCSQPRIRERDGLAPSCFRNPHRVITPSAHGGNGRPRGISRVSRRLRETVPSMLACAAVLFWGLAGAAPGAHGAMSKPAPQSAQSHAHDLGHDHSHVAPVADAGDAAGDQVDNQTDNRTNTQDRCCPPGCSFAAVTPVPLGTVVHALAPARAFAPNGVAPKSGAAPPLRPPRLS